MIFFACFFIKYYFIGIVSCKKNDLTAVNVMIYYFCPARDLRCREGGKVGKQKEA